MPRVSKPAKPSQDRALDDRHDERLSFTSAIQNFEGQMKVNAQRSCPVEAFAPLKLAQRVQLHLFPASFKYFGKARCCAATEHRSRSLLDLSLNRQLASWG